MRKETLRWGEPAEWRRLEVELEAPRFCSTSNPIANPEHATRARVSIIQCSFESLLDRVSSRVLSGPVPHPGRPPRALGESAVQQIRASDTCDLLNGASCTSSYNPVDVPVARAQRRVEKVIVQRERVDQGRRQPQLGEKFGNFGSIAPPVLRRRARPRGNRPCDRPWWRARAARRDDPSPKPWLGRRAI